MINRIYYLSGSVSSIVVGDVHGTEPALSKDFLRYSHLVLRDLDLIQVTTAPQATGGRKGLRLFRLLQPTKITTPRGKGYGKTAW